jgi:hypothetical protein
MTAKQPKQPRTDLVRSSAAEYLTFVATTGDEPDAVEVRYEDENIWLTQKMMATLYGVSVPTINEHLRHIFEDGELVEAARTTPPSTTRCQRSSLASASSSICNGSVRFACRSDFDRFLELAGRAEGDDA